METNSSNAKKEFETAINDTVNSIIRLARHIEQGDEETPLKNETLIMITKILWEAPKVTQTNETARLSGYLTALFDMADSIGLKLDGNIERFRSWERAFNVR